MNAKALLALIDECGMIELVNRSGRDIDGWIQETILRALRLLASAEAGDGTPGCAIKRFTAYRRNISERDTHSALHKNADSVPQYEGVVWSDGTATMRWLTPIRAHSVWASLYDALAIHGHPEYGTEIVWHDHESPPQEWLDQLDAARKP
jgi:hypothetical protein